MPATCDTDRLGALLEPVLPVAYRVAANLTRDHFDAEDVVQEAVLNACRGFAGFREGTNFKAWFLRIVTNVFISKYRRQARSGVAVALDAFEPGGAVEVAMERDEPAPDPLARFISQVDTEAISATLDSLPEEYRTVAVLYFVDDLSYQDIATAVGCPVGTVRSRLHRSRAHLKRQLAALAEERGYGRPVVAGRCA